MFPIQYGQGSRQTKHLHLDNRQHSSHLRHDIRNNSPIQICNKQDQSKTAMSINIENNQNIKNTSPTAPMITLAHTGINPIEDMEMKPQHDPPSYSSLDSDQISREQAIATQRNWFEKNCQPK